VDNLRVAPTHADDANVRVPAAAASAWRGARALPLADVRLLRQLANAEGLTTATLQEITGRPVEGVVSSLRNLRRQGYVGWEGSRWSIQQAGRMALELAGGEASHLLFDLRRAPGVSVTVHDARRSFHRIDLRLCPVPFRHLVFTWIESLYGTPEQLVRSPIIKSAATWLFMLLRFYADHYPSDDDLHHMSTDVVRKWVRAVLPQRQQTRDAYLDYVGRRLAALVQFCEWIQIHQPSFLPSALMPATLRRAGLAEVEAVCEANPIQIQTPVLEPPNGAYEGQRYGNKGGIYGLAGDSACPDDRARLWLTPCEHRILTVLSDERPRKRIEIAAEGGLNRYTPGNLLGKLMRAGLVEPQRQSGRPATSAVMYAITAAGHERLESEQWSEAADLWDLSQITGVRVPPSAARIGRRIDFRLVPAPQ
jgi:DNA-binding MarR family transcriptional regulator